MSGYKIEYREIKNKPLDQYEYFISHDRWDGLDRAIKEWKSGDKLVAIDPYSKPFDVPNEDLDKLESYYKEMLTKIEQFRNSRKENKS